MKQGNHSINPQEIPNLNVAKNEKWFSCRSTYHTQSEAAALSEESVDPQREGDTPRGDTISWDTPWNFFGKSKKNTASKI